MWHQRTSPLAASRKSYSRSNLLSLSNTGKVPDDWRSVDSIKKSFKQNSMAKPHRYRAKPLTKLPLPLFDNKENTFSSKPKQSLGNFILKELENSVSELTKSPAFNSGKTLNPYAAEFTITNS